MCGSSILEFHVPRLSVSTPSDSRGRHASAVFTAARKTLSLIKLCRRRTLHVRWSTESPQSFHLWSWPPLQQYLARTTCYRVLIHYTASTDAATRSPLGFLRTLRSSPVWLPHVVVATCTSTCRAQCVCSQALMLDVVSGKPHWPASIHLSSAGAGPKS